MFRCPALKEERDKEWQRLETQVGGEWVRGLKEWEKACLVAGRFPKSVKKAMKGKGIGGAGERWREGDRRVQAAFVRFGTKMTDMRRAWGGIGLWKEALGGWEEECQDCGNRTLLDVAEDGDSICRRCWRERARQEWMEPYTPCTRCRDPLWEGEEGPLCSICEAGEGQPGEDDLPDVWEIGEDCMWCGMACDGEDECGECRFRVGGAGQGRGAAQDGWQEEGEEDGKVTLFVKGAGNKRAREEGR
jgi:hypothetical protein